MGSSFSLFDDNEDDDIEQQFDDITDIVPPNEISLKKKRRTSARDREIAEDSERTDIKKSRCRNREKRKKTKRKRVSFNEEITN